LADRGPRSALATQSWREPRTDGRCVLVLRRRAVTEG
jgi:hypothetical protein